jgi:hypothetical protein
MILKMTIEIYLDDAVYNSTEKEKLLLENEILIGNGSLILHSNEMGCELGEIKKVSNIQWID